MKKINNALQRFSMTGKTVVITGGAGFLGMQYAKSLAAAGGTIILWDRNDAAILRKCVREINSVAKKIRASSYHIDITNREQVITMARSVVRRFGTIDVLINNAGLNPTVGSQEAQHMFAPYEEYTADLWNKELAVDLTGGHFCIQAVVPHMMRQHSGVIINIASEVATIAVDNRIYGEGKFKSIAYIVSKTGVLGLTRAWAAYLGKYNIRVNAFSPGGMPKAEVPEEFRKKYSSLNMLGRMASIGEYNAALLFLCSDASSFMTGTNLIMDGGKSAW